MTQRSQRPWSVTRSGRQWAVSHSERGGCACACITHAVWTDIFVKFNAGVWPVVTETRRVVEGKNRFPDNKSTSLVSEVMEK